MRRELVRKVAVTEHYCPRRTIVVVWRPQASAARWVEIYWAGCAIKGRCNINFGLGASQRLVEVEIAATNQRTLEIRG